MSHKKGFTLLEILLVVGIIAILAGIVIVAINPAKQLAQVRNTERRSDIKQIDSALAQYFIDNNHYPTSTNNGLQQICDTGSLSYPTNIDCGDLLDLSVLVPTYLQAIPKDPQASTTLHTNYNVYQDPTSRKIQLIAANAERGVVVAIGTTTNSGGGNGGGDLTGVSFFMPFTSSLTQELTGNISANEITSHQGGNSLYVTMSGDSHFAGTQSAYFPGTDWSGPWLSMPNKASAFDLGDGDFTVEIMANFDSFHTYDRLITGWDNPQRNWEITYEVGGLYFVWSNDCSGISSVGYNISLDTNHWYHFAAARSGDTIRLFIDGENVATESISGSICNSSGQNFLIGAQHDNDSSQFTGYIQGVRVTKGLARYTSNFSYPPSYIP